MQILDDHTFASWAFRRDALMAAGTLTLQARIPSFAAVEVPASAQEQLQLACDLVKLGRYREDAEEALWIKGWDRWSDWNRELGEEIVNRLRSHDGLRFTLEQASAQVMKFAERNLTVALLCQILYFAWDGWLIPPESDHLIECSHGGIVWITCKSVEVQTLILAELASWSPVIRPMISVVS